MLTFQFYGTSTSVNITHVYRRDDSHVPNKGLRLQIRLVLTEPDWNGSTKTIHFPVARRVVPVDQSMI